MSWLYKKYTNGQRDYEGPLAEFFWDGRVVCNFGDNMQYYPTPGNPPSDEDTDEMLRRLNAYDDLLAACQLMIAYGVTQCPEHEERAIELAIEAVRKATGGA